MRKYILYTLLLVTDFAYGQNNSISNTYNLLVEPYAFNFTLQEISIPIPAYMHFKLPAIDNENIYVNIDNDLNYFIPNQDISAANTYLFSLNSDDQNALEISIIPVSDFYSNTYIENIRSKYNNVDQLQAIGNGLGSSTSYVGTTEGNESRDYHVFYANDNLYQFSYSSKAKDQLIFLAIIKNVKKKKFQKEIGKYNSYLKSVYNKKINEGL